MPRPKKIPKRLPPKTKEFAKLLRVLDSYIPEMAHMEKDSIALANARIAIFPDEEPKKPKTEKPQTGDQGQPATGDQDQPATSDQGQPATGEQEQPATGEQEQPATGEQEQPATGEQEQPTTEENLSNKAKQRTKHIKKKIKEGV